MVDLIRWVTADRARSADPPARRARPAESEGRGQMVDQGVHLEPGPVGPGVIVVGFSGVDVLLQVADPLLVLQSRRPRRGPRRSRPPRPPRPSAPGSAAHDPGSTAAARCRVIPFDALTCAVRPANSISQIGAPVDRAGRHRLPRHGSAPPRAGAGSIARYGEQRAAGEPDRVPAARSASTSCAAAGRERPGAADRPGRRQRQRGRRDQPHDGVPAACSSSAAVSSAPRRSATPPRARSLSNSSAASRPPPGTRPARSAPTPAYRRFTAIAAG